MHFVQWKLHGLAIKVFVDSNKFIYHSTVEALMISGYW